MVSITVIPGKHRYTYDHEIFVSEFLNDISFFRPHPCGGKGICMKCLVKISGELSPMTEAEYQVQNPGHRLSCTTRITGNAVLYLDEYSVGNRFMEDLPDGNYAVAADVGTTSIELSFVNTDTLESFDFPPFKNPQMKFGSDVISRISAAADREILTDMQLVLLNEIKSVIASVCTGNKYFNGNLSVSGNTVMQYILNGLNTTELGVYPNTVRCDFTEEIPSKDGIQFSFNPVLSAFLGGDFLGGSTYALQIYPSEKILYMDLGTNGELFLKNGEVIHAVSCAIGPALEGMNISFGTMLTDGAAYHFDRATGEFSIKNNDKFFGITGTCLIDLISYFIDNSLIDKNGEIVKGNESFPLNTYAGQKCLKLNGTVCITQQDIRNFQLAKAAVRTAVDVLMSNFPDFDRKAEYLIIAGQFGINIDIENFINTGFIPEDIAEKYIFAGNTSLASAKMSIIDEKFRKKIILLKEKIRIEYLDKQKDFNDKFISHISF